VSGNPVDGVKRPMANGNFFRLLMITAIARKEAGSTALHAMAHLTRRLAQKLDRAEDCGQALDVNCAGATGYSDSAHRHLLLRRSNHARPVAATTASCLACRQSYQGNRRECQTAAGTGR
jgi:hypothetical protein